VWQGKLMEDAMRKTEQTTYEAACLAAAVSFTTVRGFGAKRTRKEHPSIEAARAAAAQHGDGKTMIYAITDLGQSAHIENA
jgi:hypothetical protein